MASTSPINVEMLSKETKTDTSSVDANPNTLALSLEQNCSKITDSEGPQSPASSTYGDCEETVSLSSEHSHGVNEAVVKTDAVEVKSESLNDKVDQSIPNELIDQKPATEDSNSNAEKNVIEDTSCNQKTDVENIDDENYVTDGVVNGDYEDESDQHEVEDYDEEDRQKSPRRNEIDSSEGSDFESDERDDGRGNGDGQEVTEENVNQKKLDDDEDRRNPQYIPKKGFFYEHDTRTVGTSTDDEMDDDKKKVEGSDTEHQARGRRSIPDGKWQHDLYKEDEQLPRSTQELIDIYGYDIRNEESAPKARRRRKYGRGPNKYTRQWENEEAYAKQASVKEIRGQRQRLPQHREEYENQFPRLKESKGRVRTGSRDRRDTTPKRASHREPSKNDTETKFKDEQRNYETQPKELDTTAAQTSRGRSFTQRVLTNGDRSGGRNRSRSGSFNRRSPAVGDRSKNDDRSRSRSFSRQVPARRDRSAPKYESVESPHLRKMQTPLRKPVVVTGNVVRSRGRGISVGRNSRGINSNQNSGHNNIYDGETRSYESRVQFVTANRGRGQQFGRLGQSNHRQNTTSDDDVQELSYKMSNVDLKSVKRTIINKSIHASDVSTLKSTEPTPPQALPTQSTTTVHSKRYSHQRQRLLPESSNQNTSTNVNNIVITQSLQTMTHNMSNMISSSNQQSTDVSSQPQQQQQQSQQQQHQHPSISYLPQEAQMRRPVPPAPQTNDSTMTAATVNASALPPSSLAVSASLIPLSAPPLTASGTALSSGAPPLPIVGFFQHPQGYTNQAAPAQLYSGDQTVIGGPSNQPVQLVAFLPASPMMQGTNHTQTAPPPPPPPPPPTFAGQVMSYPQTSQTQQPQPSFTSETYSLPPVTLAPMQQTPEMYQSRGGVTYYNTRSQYKPRSPPPPRVKIAIPIVPPPSNETAK